MNINSVPNILRSIPMPGLLRNAPQIAQPQDHFENVANVNPIAQPPQQDIVQDIKGSVRAFELSLNERKEQLKMADAIVNCLSPLLSKKGPVEDNVWLLLLRILGKVQGRARDAHLEDMRFAKLRKTIENEQVDLDEAQKDSLKDTNAGLEKIETSIKEEIQLQSNEENLAIGTLGSVMRSQHEAIMATLREIRA